MSKRDFYLSIHEIKIKSNILQKKKKNANWVQLFSYDFAHGGRVVSLLSEGLASQSILYFFK